MKYFLFTELLLNDLERTTEVLRLGHRQKMKDGSFESVDTERLLKNKVNGNKGLT
jgi:hypothetical protein